MSKLLASFFIMILEANCIFMPYKLFCIRQEDPLEVLAYPEST